MDEGLIVFAVAMILSTVCLTYLGLSDPKRRGERTRLTSVLRGARIGGVLLCLVPGLWLLVRQDGGYFLMWLGFVTVWGWVVAVLLRQRDA